MRHALEEAVPNGPTIPQAADIRSLLLDWFWELYALSCYYMCFFLALLSKVSSLVSAYLDVYK